MYSYKERMGAVALYIKLGKRPHATIRRLGYPSRNALKGWYLEYERRQDLPACSAHRPPKFYRIPKAGCAGALCSPRSLCVLDHAGLGVSRPRHADGLGAGGIP